MTQKQLQATVADAVMAAMKSLNERYVTADQLCEHIGSLTPRFLKDHGQMFPRKQFKWVDREGHEHRQGWLYPLHEIKQQFLDGGFRET